MSSPKKESFLDQFYYSQPENTPARNYGAFGVSPVYSTPITPIEGSMHTFQEMPRCRDFELRAAKCIEAYGYYKSNEKCGLLMKDLSECVFRAKQNKRLYLMTKEHRRQIANGEREYMPIPRIDLL